MKLLVDKSQAEEELSTGAEDMTEQKTVFPAYVRIGKCGACGASVYAPEMHAFNGVLPLMSACACEHGPRISHASGADKSTRARGTNTAREAKAA
jgi:hypothetical protein